MKRCIYCQIERPISAFRRYSYRKVREMPSCNLCVPPKKLSNMSPKEREIALQTTHRNTSPVLVARLNERDKARKSETLSRRITTHNLGRRRANWDTAILRNARAEHRWAYSTHLRYRTQLQQGNAQRQPHVDFFEEYLKILKYMVQTIEFKATRPNAPLTPTQEECNPRNYITSAEYLKLKTLYANCSPIPGTRTAREPWFLFWREPEEEGGNATPNSGG